MAIEANINASDHVFIGEAKQLVFSIYKADAVTPQDVTGWALEWSVRKTEAAADPAVLNKTTGAGISITGTYNADPAVNTQQVVVQLASGDTAAVSAKSYKHALKRTDAGSETVLAFGTFVLLQSAAH